MDTLNLLNNVLLGTKNKAKARKNVPQRTLQMTSLIKRA